MKKRILILALFGIIGATGFNNVNASNGMLEGHECMTKQGINKCDVFTSPVAKRLYQEDRVGKGCISGCAAYGNENECERQLGMFGRYDR